MAGQAKENLPGGSLKYLFVYLKVRIFKCSYRIYIYMCGRTCQPSTKARAEPTGSVYSRLHARDLHGAVGCVAKSVVCVDTPFFNGCWMILVISSSFSTNNSSKREERLRDLLVDGTDLSVAEDRHQATEFQWVSSRPEGWDMLRQ